jgi:hypothetical protein
MVGLAHLPAVPQGDGSLRINRQHANKEPVEKVPEEDEERGDDEPEGDD